MLEIWSNILEIGLDAIELGDDFFQLGGDSVAAMKMVARAREENIEITVADIFCHITLVEQAVVKAEPLAIGLLEVYTNQKDVEGIATIYGVEAGDILDVYLSTPLQEGLLSLSSKQPGDYTWNMALVLLQNIPTKAFHSAWENVFNESDILRTRILQYSTLGSLQVVLDEIIEWIKAAGLE